MRANTLSRLAPLLLLSGCALITLSKQQKSWPDLDDVHVVHNTMGPIEIVRDELAVPHIRASSRADAMYGIGFVQAQDRLFQADMTRRAATGGLSELVGERAVDVDHFMKGLGLAERADASLKRAGFIEQAMVEAFVLGFNAGIDSFGEELPIEYQLLDVDVVAPWTQADVMASAYLQSWNLAENPRQELAALGMGDLPAEQLDVLLRFDAYTPKIDDYWDELRQADRGDWTDGWKAWMSLFGGVPEASQASNNWIVGPSRSADGMPILANDPHLGQGVPSLWYVIDAAWPDGQVAGVALAGSPLVVIGHNKNVAWGFTNVMVDYIDFAVLERKEDQVIVAGEAVDLRKVETKVRVKGQGLVTGETLWTDIGPVITELDGTHVVVLRWHALELEDETARGFFKLNMAGSVTEALKAVDRPMMVAQNLMVADTSGDWAWQAFGAAPKRKAHTGRVPYPGSDPAHGWDGWLAHMPGERQPERGWVATANSRPKVKTPAATLDEEGALVPFEFEEGESIDPWALSTAYVPPWRMDRIGEMLSADDSVTPEDMHQMQLDVKDRSAQVLLPSLLKDVEGSTTQARKCLALLSEWDYEVTTSSPAASAWLVFQLEVLREALVDDIGKKAFEVLTQAHGSGRNLLAAGIGRFQGDRVDEVDRALTATCQRLESRHGPDVTNWAWGAIHPLQLEHPFAATSSLLKKWNLPSVPFPGNSATVAAAGASWHGELSPVGGMPSVRLVMPTSDLSKSTLVFPGGQSGLPTHPDTLTHFDAFVGGKTLPLYFDENEIRAHARNTTWLQPPGTTSQSSQPAPAPVLAPTTEGEEGEAVEGDENEAAEGEESQGESADGESADGESAEGGPIEGEAAEPLEAAPDEAEEAAGDSDGAQGEPSAPAEVEPADADVAPVEDLSPGHE
jgi:penicillin amidase